MAHTAQTWQELIPDLFCPHVAVMCTRDAEAVCQKNNLAFVEMMRPFCQLTTEGKQKGYILAVQCVVADFFCGC